MTKWGIAFGTNSNQTQIKPLNYVKFNYTNQPIEIFSKLHQKYKTAYLLESIEGPQKLAQYSFLGFDPKINITAKNGTVTITNTQNQPNHHPTNQRPLQTHPRTTATLRKPHGGLPFCRRRIRIHFL